MDFPSGFRRWFGGLAALALIAGFTDASPSLAAGSLPPAASAVDVVERDGQVEIRIDLVAPVPFTFFSLSDPDRIVIDFGELAWELDPPVLDAEAPVSAVRIGQRGDGGARLVLDLREPLRVVRADGGIDVDGPMAVSLMLERTDPAEFRRIASASRPESVAPQTLAVEVPRAEPGTIVVAVDPGHGGVDHGAERGPLTEKSIVLRVAKTLAARLNAEPGFSAVLTRDRDRFVSLADRVRIAQTAGAHVFVSLHADLLEDGGASGLAVYTLSDRGVEVARQNLAVEENRGSLLGGIKLEGEGDDLARVLVDLAQRGTVVESEKLAAKILAHLDGEFELLRTRPHREAGFRVLKAPDIPSVLIEMGFLSSERDRRRLVSPGWQRNLADALTSGIRGWAAVASPGFLHARK